MRCLLWQLDLTKNPPLRKMNLIVYRGQISTFSAEKQASILSLLHYSLTPGGLLALGPSERLESGSGLLSAVTGASGIYVRNQSLPLAVHATAREPGSDGGPFEAPLPSGADTKDVQRRAKPQTKSSSGPCSPSRA